MSKKLIAVAAAAALALTGLVGVAPATSMPYNGESQLGNNSLMITGSVARGSGTDGTLAKPYLVPVPESGLATSATTMKFSISATASRPYTVAATAGIKVIAAVSATTKVVLSGADSLSGTTSAAGAAEFFVYPTTTTKGVVTLTFDGSDITQVYVTGVVGKAYDIGAVTLPSLEPSKQGVIVAVVTDAFGNVVDSDDDQSLTVTRVGTGSPTSTDVQYSATSKRWEGTVTAGANAGQLAVSLVIAGLTATTDQKAVFGDPNNTYFGIINVAAAPTVAALTAQITALTTTVAGLTADYNALAKKWNKRVASRTAPKVKAALK